MSTSAVAAATPGPLRQVLSPIRGQLIAAAALASVGAMLTLAPLAGIAHIAQLLLAGLDAADAAQASRRAELWWVAGASVACLFAGMALVSAGELTAHLADNRITHHLRLAVARRLAQAVLPPMGRQLGPEHPFVTATYDLIGRIERNTGNWEASRDAHARALEIRARTRGMVDGNTIESANRLYVALFNLRDEAGMRDLRARFLDPLIARDPGTLNASLRSVREASLLALKGRWD